MNASTAKNSMPMKIGQKARKTALRGFSTGCET